MRTFSRSVWDLLLCPKLHLLLLLAVFGGAYKSQAQEQIYGSGEFILNEGPVYSDMGMWIGSSAVTDSSVGGSVSSGLIGTWPVFNDQLPHSINASAVNGKVTKSPDQAVYDFDTLVTITAVADPGFVFEKWTVNGTPSFGDRFPTLTLRANHDSDVVAHFVPISRIIFLFAVDLSWQLQVSGGSSSGTFKIVNAGNSPLTVENITYPAGFNGSWKGIIGPGSSEVITVNFAPPAAGTYSGNITVNSDATAGTPTIPVSATAQNAYSLTGTSSFGKSITQPASRKYWQGSVVTLKAMPVTGYVFMNWTEDGKILSTDANFDLPIVQEHHVWANYLLESRRLKLAITRGFGARKVGSTYRATVSIENTGSLPVYLSDLRFQSSHVNLVQVSGMSSCWIAPRSIKKVAIAYRPTQGKSYRLGVSAIATDLSSPAKPVILRGGGFR